MSKEFGEGLDKAVQKVFTRPVPKSAGAQMRYLVKQYKSTMAVAQMLRVSQRTVERYVKNQIKKPRPALAARLEREVKARWQPQIRAKAKEKAATTGGIVIDVHARLGYAGAPMGTTDEDRLRQLTVALPPQYAARLFDAQQQGANEDRLRELAADALREVYFQDGGRRAGSLQEVQINDVQHLEFGL